MDNRFMVTKKGDAVFIYKISPTKALSEEDVLNLVDNLLDTVKSPLPEEGCESND